MAYLDHRIKYVDCDGCGESVSEYRECENCAKIERLKGIKCPCCKKSNIAEEEVNKDNGIIGPGFSSWPLLKYLTCLDCGVMFKNMKK